MRKLFRTYLFGWFRKTNSISRYLAYFRETFDAYRYSTTPHERFVLLRELKRLDRGIKRMGRL